MTTPPPSEPGEMAHTGGAWRVYLDQNGRREVRASASCTIAALYSPPSGNVDANARLIAAAPDMAEAIAAHLAARDALADAAVTSLHPDDPRFAEVARTLALLRAALSRALKDQGGGE